MHFQWCFLTGERAGSILCREMNLRKFWFRAEAFGSTEQNDFGIPGDLSADFERVLLRPIESNALPVKWTRMKRHDLLGLGCLPRNNSALPAYSRLRVFGSKVLLRPAS